MSYVQKAKSNKYNTCPTVNFLNDPCPTVTIHRIQSGKQYSRYKTDPRGENTRVPFTTLQSTLQHTIRTGVQQKRKLHHGRHDGRYPFLQPEYL